MAFLTTPARLLPRLTTLTSTTTHRAFSSTPRPFLARMQLIGRLAAEPELTSTATGKELVKYAVGVSTGPRDARETSWFRVASFDEGARRDLLLGLQKGTLVFVDAESRMRTFEDGEGKKVTRLDLVQREFFSFFLFSCFLWMGFWDGERGRKGLRLLGRECVWHLANTVGFF